MADYVVNKNNTKVQNLHLFVRKTGTAETLTVQKMLEALVSDFDKFGTVISLDNTSDGGDITSSNKIYECNTTAGNVALDFDDESIPLEATNDVVLIKHSAGTNQVIVTDGLDVAVTLSDINDFLVLYYDGSRWVHQFVGKLQTVAETTYLSYFFKVGQCEQGMSYKTGEGKTYENSEGEERLASETIEFNAMDINASKDNYAALRAIMNAGNADIIFYNEVDSSAVRFDNIPFKVFIEKDSGDFIKFNISGKSEPGNVDDKLTLLDY